LKNGTRGKPPRVSFPFQRVHRQGRLCTTYSSTWTSQKKKMRQ
jgi:hypothetical protein